MKSIEIGVTVPLDIGGIECDATLKLSVIPGSPGCYSGPPERCYPADAAEVEILSASAADEDGKEIDVLERFVNDDDLFERVQQAAEDELERIEASAREDHLAAAYEER